VAGSITQPSVLVDSQFPRVCRVRNDAKKGVADAQPNNSSKYKHYSKIGLYTVKNYLFFRCKFF